MSDISLSEAMCTCQEADVMRLVREKLDACVTPEAIVAECNEGMIELGDRFDKGEAFIPDLMFAGMIMKKVMNELAPLLKADDEASDNKKKLVIGTVQHDVHDIGKDITAMVFQSSGFSVVDLGVDVSPEKFVAAIREHKPQFVGMSLLLTTCYKAVTETIEAIKAAGLRDDIKILVGGAAASELMAQRSGCDFYGKTAVDGLRWASAEK
ncbi:MAG: cobalamin B12-binding domain-containing protein [Thermoguttaceae bacterium]